MQRILPIRGSPLRPCTQDRLDGCGGVRHIGPFHGESSTAQTVRGPECLLGISQGRRFKDGLQILSETLDNLIAAQYGTYGIRPGRRPLFQHDAAP